MFSLDLDVLLAVLFVLVPFFLTRNGRDETIYRGAFVIKGNSRRRDREANWR